jgi:hypothetical protein
MLTKKPNHAYRSIQSIPSMYTDVVFMNSATAVRVHSVNISSISTWRTCLVGRCIRIFGNPEFVVWECAMDSPSEVGR